MEQLLFCANHPEKIAKRHCNKCDQNLCNECIFESHIDHHEEIKKIEYLINTKQKKVSEILSKEIKSIIDKSFNELKPQINKLVLEETEQYIKDHKNLQLKATQSKKEKHVSIPIKKEPKPNSNFYQNVKKFSQQQEQGTVNKNIIRSISVGPSNSSIMARAKMFDLMNKKEVPKKYDENNPFSKGVEKNKGVKDIAKIFDQK